MSADQPVGDVVTVLKVHPLAQAIPEMLADEYADLERDIEANGLREPITLLEKMILDGLHRFRARVETRVEVRTKEFTGTLADARAYVASLNLHRLWVTHAAVGREGEVMIGRRGTGPSIRFGLWHRPDWAYRPRRASERAMRPTHMLTKTSGTPT